MTAQPIMQIIVSDFQDHLVRGLAHRMNNILTLFHGYLGLLLDNQKLDRLTLEGLEKIKSGADAASNLMDRLNALTRPNPSIAREVVLDRFLEQLRPSFEAVCGCSIELTIESEPGLPTAWLDSSRLRLALAELVANSVEAIRGKGRIALNAARDGESLVISVSDTGHGIPAGFGDKIYEPFVTTKKNQIVAGLGLTVVVACAQQMGGVVSNESKKNGSIFRITVPIRTQAQLSAVA